MIANLCNSDAAVSVVHSEIEMLVGGVYKGDATYLVYNLLKDTSDLKGLLEYLTGEGIKDDVHFSVAATPGNEESNGRPCFKRWISQFEQL